VKLSYLLIATLLVLALIAGAFMAGRWTASSSTTQPEAALAGLRTVVITKYVDRVSSRAKRVVHVKQPDGTETTTTDETEHTAESIKEVPPPPAELKPLVAVLIPKREDWRVGAGVGLTFSSGPATVIYSFELDRRLLGPVWVGVRANTTPYIGASIGVTF
jgi:hypothetical protein